MQAARSSESFSGKTLCRFLQFGFVVALWWVLPVPSPAAEVPPGHALFTDSRIRTFKIEVGSAALAALKKNERSYVRARVTEGDRAFVDVGIHLKGMGSFQSLEQKPSFAVKFDRYTPEQDYEGLTKIMLNNAGQDSTWLAELLSNQMFRDAGVPVARVTHAFVEFNDRKLGLYVLIEAMNKEFLKQHFRKASGNLYEAYLQDIDQKLDQDSGDDTSQADLKKLLEICRLENPAERWSRLPSVFEVDRYLSHCAVEMFIAHTDGYAMNRNNYRLYRDPATRRFTLIAHGTDWGFANTGAPIRPPLGSIITKAVLTTPEGRRLYREHAGQLFTNVFQLDVLSNRVATAVQHLKAAARNPAEAKQFEDYGAEMRRRFTARHENVARQLSLPEAQPLKFDASGVAALTGWRTEKKSGNATLDLAPQDGKTLLSIKSGEGGCIASWRTRVILPAGKFRFTGEARAEGIEPDTSETGAGAGLRISGGKRTNKLEGDAPWQKIEYEFDVSTDGDEKELVCELRAKRGAVWFAMDSLKLTRLK